MASSSGERPEGSQAQWSQLPPELLEIIARKAIGNISDHIRFRSVCRAWRAVAFPQLVKLPPLLMLPYDTSIDDRSFLSLSSNSLLTVSLPEAHKKRFLTSSHGWLVMRDSSTYELSLFNPVTRAQIPLPPTTDFGQNRWVFLPTFAFLSSDPDSADGDCVVIIKGLCSPEIVFCRPRDEAWTVFHTDLTEFPRSILYRQGRFYLIDDQEIFYIYNADSNPSRRQLICQMQAPLRGGVLGFLEKTTGAAELFMFVDNRDFLVEETNFLTIFRLDMSTEPPEWSEVGDIGDRTLFWTAEPRSSDPTLFWTAELRSSFYSWDFPEYRANCIYYCAPYVFRPERIEPLVHEIEVFDIMNQSFEFLSTGWEEPPHHVMPAMWFTPSLRRMRM